jgi:putative addiction module component (TIGR02574 family)
MNAPLLSPEQIAKLSAEDRLSLISDLWDSLAEADIPVSAAHEAELDRRDETYASDSSAAQSWASVRERVSKAIG